MWMGTVDLTDKWTTPPDVAGIRVSRQPEVEFTEPDEHTLFTVVGFGHVVVPEVENGKLVQKVGEAREIVMTVSNHRAVVIVARGKFPDGMVDVRRGFVYLADLPLAAIEAVNILRRKRMRGGVKPTELGFMMAQGVFGLRVEPVVVQRDGQVERPKDPTPVAEALVGACFADDPTHPDVAWAQARGWQTDEDGHLELLLHNWAEEEEKEEANARDAGEEAHVDDHPPAMQEDPQPLEAPAQEAAAEEAAAEEQPAAPTAGPPVFPTYVMVDVSASSQPWLEIAGQYLGGLTARSEASDDGLRVAAMHFGASPEIVRPLAPADDTYPPVTLTDGPADLDAALQYLAVVIDHDMTWLKSQGRSAFRPTVILLSGAGHPASDVVDHALGSDATYAPNVIAIGLDADAESAILPLGAAAAFVLDGSISPADAAAHAISTVSNVVRSAADAAERGDPVSLEVGSAIPGFRRIG